MVIRSMKKEDIVTISKAFIDQGWSGRHAVLKEYLKEQETNKRYMFIAESENEVTGYVSIIPEAVSGPFNRVGYPEIKDFIVFEKYQNQGIGTQLLNAAEEKARSFSPVVTLSVGLHSGYGTAQQMYVKNGYIPDSSGVWFESRQLSMNEPCINNDDLVLYFLKTF